MKNKLLRLIKMISYYSAMSLFVQVIFINLIFANDLSAQRAKSVEKVFCDLHLKNASLQEAFNTIEIKTGFKFSYDNADLDPSVKINMDAHNVSLKNILLNISKESSLRFRQVNFDIDVQKIPVRNKANDKNRVEVIQGTAVSGRVTAMESGEPLPGVNVLEKGTFNGTVTDIDGRYTLAVSGGNSTLVFSFIGFQTQEVPVENRNIVDLMMTIDVQALEEVVVVGYGIQREKDLTSAISTVKSEEIAKSPAGQTMNALQGKVPGMQIVTSGAPGSSPTVRVRGIGSYESKDASPLYVVDGMFFDNIDFLSPSDIATVSVLKDASAAAIYGVRAANGVVLIETKSGKVGQKAIITYDGYFGTQIAQNVLKMANAEQFTAMAMESASAADANNILNAMQRYGRSRINPNVPDVNTDWYKEIIRPAPIQNHSLNIMGGGESTSYSIGASYFSQEGILDMKNEYERFNLRSKLDYHANDWLTIGGNVNISNATKFEPEDAAWSQAYWAVPILPIYDEQNTDARPVGYNFASAQHIGFRSGQNPFPALLFNENFFKIRKYLANFYLKIDFIPEKLVFKTTYNNGTTFLNQRDVDLPYYVSDNWQRPNATLMKKNETYMDHIWDNVLTYSESFGNHNMTAMAGTSFRDESFEMLTAKGIDFPVDNKKLWYIAQSDRSKIPIDAVNDNGRRLYGLSYFGRVAYNYADKYLLYGTFRADGNNKYQQKWGYFPTIGAGWVISEEAFMNNVGLFDFLKLRLSWGELGNDKVPSSDGANTISEITTAINDARVTGLISTNTFSYIGWEVIEEWNAGVTSRLLKNRLSLDADYFIRDTKNAVIPVYIPFAAVFVRRDNGVIRNSGFELALNWDDQLFSNFSYSIGANLATLKNEVRDLYGQPYLDGGSAEFRQRSIVGQPLLAFFGYEVEGVYQNDEQIQADPVATANNLVPGDFKYKDQNQDNIINDEDRVVLGSYFPSFTYGLNVGITYGNFDLSTNIMGQHGNKILNRKRGEVIWTPDLNMDADLAKNRWHGEGTSNKYPSSAGLRKGWNQKMSDYFVEDGSFFRIQNLQLGYRIKLNELFGPDMPSARVTFTADRPLTVFKYNGFNPEVADGIDRQTYPIPAVYTIGLNLTF